MELVTYRGKYCVYWRDGAGRPIRRSLGTSDADTARRRFEEFKRSLEVQRHQQGYTIAQLWEKRRTALEGRRLASNMEHSGKALLPVFGVLNPSQVSQELIDRYVKERGKAPGTIWTEINHLRMTLNWAVKKGLIQSVPHFSLPRKPPPRHDHLTKAQARDFLAHCLTPHTKLFVILAFATGARNAALLELTWDRVDLERRLIHLATPDMIHKKGRAIVPINDMLFAALVEAKALARSPYVIEWAGEKVGSVKKSIERAAKKAGFSFNVSPHLFRHSAAVWMAEAGVAMEEIAQFLGHSDVNITRRVYARYSPDYLRTAAGALEL